MTVPNGDPRAKRTASTSTPERGAGGRFGAGNSFGQGRPKSSITAALRRKVDPEQVADMLLEIMCDPKAATRERVRCIELITDRLEGKAVSRSISMSLGAARALPIGFDAMDPSARERVLDELRARALAGDTDLLEAGENGCHDNEDNNDGE